MDSIVAPSRHNRVHIPPRFRSTSTSSRSHSTTTVTTALLPSLMDSNDKPSPFAPSSIVVPPWRSTSSPDLASDCSTSRRNQQEPSSPSSPPSTPQLSTPPSTPSNFSRPFLTSSEPWTDFSLNLLFTADGTSDPIPPSFYPSARIYFSPQLRIQSPSGIPYSKLGGMHLGVTGTVEILDDRGKVKSQRVIADFTTDIGAGLSIWKRDAEKARRNAGIIDQNLESEGEKFLPPGTYVLPLSMRIPRSDKLPPSFECSQFRITYTMCLALFSSATTSNGNPKRLKVFSIPFHVLPSTLPTPPPEVPILTHTHRKGVFASLMQSLSSTPKSDAYHVIIPSIPSMSFSPGSFSTIPVSIRIVDRPIESIDLYIRIALIRRIYVRESSSSSLAVAIENDFGVNGISPALLNLPEEVLMERWCKEETELVSRWGYIPYSSRPGANPAEKAEVIIQDLTLPLSGLNESGWNSGYSTALDLEPTIVPDQSHHGECSWFSPAFRHRPPVAREYSKHVHISSKFFLSIEIGFANSTLHETLQAIKIISPDMEVPSPATFTSPQIPSTSRFSGASLSNPFLPLANSNRSHRPSPTTSTSASTSTTSPFNPAPSFPGKFREIFIPIEIGSVAEPSLDCISRADESSTSRAEREGREERGEDTRADGEGGEGAWRIAPPDYEDAISKVPAYLFTC